MRRLLLAAVLAGCGGAPAVSGTTAVRAAAPGGDDRVRELEERLAARTAEVQDLRGELARAETAPVRDVVRIRRDCDERSAGADASIEVQVDTDPPARSDAQRPVLR